MRRAVEPGPVRLDRVEEQHEVGASHIRMSHHRNWIARLVRPRSPPAGGHDADSRSLDGPCPHRGRIRRAGLDSDDDVAVGVLPPVLLHDSPIRNVPAHVEHRAGMVGERRSRRQGDSNRDCQGQQRPPSARASSNHQDRSILARDSTGRSEGGLVHNGTLTLVDNRSRGPDLSVVQRTASPARKGR